MDARLGRVRVSAICVPVPETTVHEDYGAVPRKNQIGTARKIFAIKAESEAQAVSDPTYYKLGHCVASLDSGHDLASSLAVHNVDHSTNPMANTQLNLSLLTPTRRTAIRTSVLFDNSTTIQINNPFFSSVIVSYLRSFRFGGAGHSPNISRMGGRETAESP